MIPKLNDTPKYDLVIPSLNKEVKFRPYLVKEEKVLLMAFEADDQKVALNAVADTITSCINEDIKVNDLKLYDIEYMFTKIRAKSIGENANLTVTCEECNYKTDTSVDIDTVQIVETEDKPDDVIQITDSVSVEMMYPNFLKMISNDKIMSQQSTVESVIELIADCIVCINTEEEKIMMRDEPREKILEFIESMTNDQFGKLRDYVESVPRVEINHEYVCEGCKKKRHIKIRNVSDFF
tara:strand:+ start:70 stop:783 length:714 start_codon:yes stop_codon:yes gene_type:complete